MTEITDQLTREAAEKKLRDSGGAFCSFAQQYNDESAKLEPLRKSVEGAYSKFLDACGAMRESGASEQETIDLSVEILREGGVSEEEIQEALDYRSQLVANATLLSNVEKSAVL